MNKKYWIYLNRLSLAYILVFILAILADVVVYQVVEFGVKSEDFVGCYSYATMLLLFDCQGFLGASLLGEWLAIPIKILLSPIFAFIEPSFAVLAVIGWGLPFLYFVSLR